MVKSRFNVYEEKILRIMRMYYSPMTLNEIADGSTIHWKTAEKYVEKLVKMKLIKKTDDGCFQARRYENI